MVSALEEEIRNGRRETQARAREPLDLQATVLEEALLPIVERALSGGTTLELDDLRSAVGQPVAQHPLARQVTSEDVLASRLFPGTSLPARLRFRSPTS